ncbi:MAG: DnaD domain protein [Ruminococcaceae bacterium]|nr:DnaD domain protein [Oscillospiraceae bacterium]
MKIQWNFGGRVLTLPAAVAETDATPRQLRVLFLLAAGTAELSELAKALDCKQAEILEILAFWQEKGVLQTNLAPTASKEEKKASAVEKPKKLSRADEIPTYSLAELNDMLERRASLRFMIEEAQQIMGKLFNTYEINILLGMVDYLELDEDYVLLLLAHCMRIDKKGLRTIERYAISLIDRGITTADALENELQAMEERHTLEGKVRTVFGLKSRSLTTKEQKLIAAWASFGYGEEIIRRAYEITVDSIHEPSMSYTNAILERWHANGLKTLEEIEQALNTERAEKEKASGESSKADFKTFDPNDAFEAALRRSYKKKDSN